MKRARSWLGLALLASVATVGVAGAPGLLEHARELKDQKKYAAAEELLREEVGRDPKNAEAQRLLGWVCAAQGKKAAAKAAFSAARKLLPPTDPRQKELQEALARLDQPAAKGSGPGGALNRVAERFANMKTGQADIVLDFNGVQQTPQGPKQQKVSGRASIYFDQPNQRMRFEVDFKLPPEAAQQMAMMMPGIPAGSAAIKMNILASKQGFYMLFPATKTGMKMMAPPGGFAKSKGKETLPGGPPMGMPPGAPTPADLMQMKDRALSQLKRTGSQKLNGQACDVYTATNPQGPGSAKLWVRASDAMPMKATFDSGPQGKGTIEFKNVRINQPVSASLFAPPNGYQLTDMMEAMGKAMGKGGAPGAGFPGKGTGKALPGR